MYIYVVQEGDSLYKISKNYEVNINSLAAANGLSLDEGLIVGQALLVPTVGNIYIVRENDTLFKIGRKLEIPYQVIADVNNINVLDPLKIGQKLFIPPKERKRIEVNAYLEPLTKPISNELLTATSEIAPFLTYLSLFSYRIEDDGSLIKPPTNDLQKELKQSNTTMTIVLTNIRKGEFSSDLARTVLTKESVSEKVIKEIVSEAKRLNVNHIHIDFEFIPPELKEEYTAFLERAKDVFSKERINLSVALAPKISDQQTGPWYGAHDYFAIGKIADFVVLMTYEWGYSGGPPMPVSPIMPVREVVEYALENIPREKIMLGQNLYGYDWTLPFVEGGDFARALSPQTAINLARERRAEIMYDKKNEAPFFTYYDEDKNEHIVWFEDARSIQAKFDLIKELNLRGISYWKISFLFPQNWLLLEDNFEIIKK